MDLPIDTISNRISKALSMRNMKSIELSELTGIPKSSISQYLAGYVSPKTDRIFLMAKALDVKPQWLLGYDVSMEPDRVAKKQYYLDDETAEYADFLLKNEKYKILLDASRKLTKDDLDIIIGLVERMKNKGE